MGRSGAMACSKHVLFAVLASASRTNSFLLPAPLLPPPSLSRHARHPSRGLTCSAQRLVVVGGGAAGFMGAIEAARGAKEAGGELEVVVCEATSKCCGKVKISGGGRCNVMHDVTKPVKLIAEGYPRGQKQLLGPFARFGPPQTAEWFRAEGVELKTEQDGRMFPVTDSSQTVIDALTAAADAAGVRVRTRCRVEGIEHAGGGGGGGRFRVRTVEREADRREEIDCDYLLLATGSARTSYAWAKGLGHDLEAPVPSLFTFTVSDPLLQGLAGLSVQDAVVSIPSGKPKRPLTQQGPVLVTHSGVSGPAILRLSAFGARVLHGSDYKTTLKINWTPDVERGMEGVLEMLLEAKAKDSGKTVGGASSPTFGLPRRLWQAMVAKVGVEGETKWAEVKNADLRKVAALMCQCQLEVQGKGTFKDEFVTAGGVSLKGVDMKRLESKSVEGLYFAGEVLDIDGITGGYNFQSAWTTGWTAGRAVAERATGVAA